MNVHHDPDDFGYSYYNRTVRIAETTHRAVVPLVAPVLGIPVGPSARLIITTGREVCPVAPGEEFFLKKSCPCYYLYCFFFGLCGAHRFYLSSECKYLGLLWLLTFGLFGVGWFIDLFLGCHLVGTRNRDKSRNGGRCGKPRSPRLPYVLGEVVKCYQVTGSQTHPRMRKQTLRGCFLCEETVMYNDGDDQLLPAAHQAHWERALQVFESHIPEAEAIIAQLSTGPNGGGCCNYQAVGWLQAHTALQNGWVMKVNADLWPLGFAVNCEHSTDMVQVRGIWSLCPCFRYNLRIFICLSTPPVVPAATLAHAASFPHASAVPQAQVVYGPSGSPQHSHAAVVPVAVAVEPTN